MRFIALAVRLICGINTVLGHLFSWFSLVVVLLCFTVVILRYFFSIGFVWLQDLYVWMNALMFTGIAGFTLLRNGHVRVDIFYRTASAPRRALVDIFGCVFFIGPFVYVLFAWSLPYVQRSWRFLESSTNAGGMPGLYVVKTFVLVFATVIAIQALAMVLRGVLVLAGRETLLPEHLRYPREG